ncbi:MAG: methyltransferase domain-containing protein [Syntrophobacteraceae bacterium]
MVNSSASETACPEMRYEEGHWIRSGNLEYGLRAYLEQQSTSYSQVKNAFVRDLIGSLKGLRFLDFGCGAGMFMVHAAMQGAALTVGVDVEETVLKTARYFAGKHGLADRCHFICSRGFPFHAAAPHFDVVLIKDVLEHVPHDQELLNAAAGLLAPGGCMVVSTQNALSLNYLIEGTLRKFFRHEKKWRGWDPTHLRFYTPGVLRGKLDEAGLKIVDWRSAYIIPHKLPAPASSGRKFYRIEALSRADRFLGRIFPFRMIGWNVIVKGEKKGGYGRL